MEHLYGWRSGKVERLKRPDDSDAGPPDAWADHAERLTATAPRA
jgi:hypothetical protein